MFEAGAAPNGGRTPRRTPRRGAARILPGLLSLAAFGCEAYDQPLRPEIFQTCCGNLGTCLPEGLVPTRFRERLGADSCAASLLCVPSELAEDVSHVLATCRAVGNLEGRCIPACLPEAAERADALERGSCREGELCGPCYDPRTGADTQLCHVGGDPGPAEPPRIFPSCCGGRARCVPRDILARSVSEADREALGRVDCAALDDTCVPEPWLDDASQPAPSCRALADGEGRCVLDCLSEVAEQADKLHRDACQAGELCAPCYDPRTGENTGLCTRGQDRPREPPKTFAPCCSLEGLPRGRCVPDELLDSLSESDAARLSKDSCAARSEQCVPERWLDSPAGAPPVCRAEGVEGRCLSLCFPDVQSRAADLSEAGCGAAERCVPCYDPRSGEDTGACRTVDDQPTEAPATFARCCLGTGETPHGRCIPKATLARSAEASDVARLGRDSCSDDSLVCVPDAWVESGAAVPANCRALGHFEGRCLPSCLPDVSQRAAALRQDNCGRDELCVPCFDPRDGSESGACRIAGDQPREAAQPFPSCCGGTASCVDGSLIGSLVSSDDVHRLGADSCSDASARCVPNGWLDPAGMSAPRSCRSLAAVEGRCLPDCLPELATERTELLPREGCGERELCAPCFDPQTLEETGACRLAGDAPLEAARGFAPCCESGGRAQGACVPAGLLGEDQLALPQDSCQRYPARCVPAPLVASPPQSLEACETTLGSPGVCFATCFLGPEAALTLLPGGCGLGARCVPCSALPVPQVGCE